MHVASDERVDVQVGRYEANDRQHEPEQVHSSGDSEAPEAAQCLGEVVFKHGSRHPRGCDSGCSWTPVSTLPSSMLTMR